MVECSDKTLYTGITSELERRIEEHNASEKGAKYTRSRRPVTLVHCETYPDRSTASKREHTIKQMSRKTKQALLNHPKQAPSPQVGIPSPRRTVRKVN